MPSAIDTWVLDLDDTLYPRSNGLAAAIAALPGRKFVFTNGSAYHAEQALDRLGLTGPTWTSRKSWG